jgi:precorrin-6B methylase 2
MFPTDHSEAVMSYLRTPRLVFCTLAVLLVLCADQGSGRDDSSKQTTLRVLVPRKRVRVLLDGKAAGPKSGSVREITAAPPAGGKKEHEVTAVWWNNDYTKVIRTRKVAPKPGGTVVVDLRTPDPKNPDRIEIRYVPTPHDVVDRMCTLARIGKDDVVYDLGCGDGRMVLAALADFKAKRGVGVDLEPERIRESVAGAKKLGVSDRVEFRVGDVLKIKDLSSATVVMLYMGEAVNLRLRPILEKTLKPGARIVSHRFGMGDWKPDKTEVVDGLDGERYRIHLWTIKKK